MGTFCPECKTHQAFARNVTADGGPVSKDNPILARVLACGHTLSGGAHRQYIERCTEIRVDAALQKTKIDQAAEAKMSALWETLTAKEAA